MQTKIANKLALNQETVRNLTENQRFQLRDAQKFSPKSVCFPVCTPALGAK